MRRNKSWTRSKRTCRTEAPHRYPAQLAAGWARASIKPLAAAERVGLDGYRSDVGSCPVGGVPVANASQEGRRGP